jgi:hypothetical protein
MHSSDVNASTTDSIPSPRVRSSILSSITASSFSRFLVVIGFLSQIFVAWRFANLTWDDSAITLAFSRTFALTGRIEPTPGSGIVEGYSTTLWMLLMTLAAKCASTPAALLAIAKVSTLLLNLANILLIRRWFLTWTNEICANLIAGIVGSTLMFYETINGMETPLILALVFVMLLLLPLPGRVARLCYLLAGSAFLLTRWEAAWLLVPFILVERSKRRSLASSFTWLSVFIASNLVRWRYFGSLLPNTIIAKRGAPYSRVIRSLEIQRHIHEPLYILLACKLLFLFLAVSLLYDRFVLKDGRSIFDAVRSSFRSSWQLRFTTLFVLFSFVLTTAIGANWGPPFRSFYSAWPFLFCLIFLPLISNSCSRALPWFTAAIFLFVLLRMSIRVHDLYSKEAPVYMPDTTIAKIALINTAITDIQAASHHPNLLFAGPDMGAILLYSNGVRVIDLGLLCDPVLARQRYPAIDSYVIHQRQPDVIEGHQDWTTLTNLHASPLFLSRYRPVYVNGKRFFLTRALIADIDPARLTKKFFDRAGYPDEVDRVPFDITYIANDYSLNKDFGSYLVLK